MNKKTKNNKILYIKKHIFLCKFNLFLKNSIINRYRINLEGTEPDLDDILLIKSPINITSNVLFIVYISLYWF